MENLRLNLQAQDSYFRQLLEKEIQPAEAEEELKVSVLWQSHQRNQEGFSLLIEKPRGEME